MRDWIILNGKGMVIGMVSDTSREHAIGVWNKANHASPEVAVDAYLKDDDRPLKTFAFQLISTSSGAIASHGTVRARDEREAAEQIQKDRALPGAVFRLGKGRWAANTVNIDISPGA